MMRTFTKVILVLALSVAAFSCKKDNNKVPNYFTEPYLGFGKGEADVKSYEKRSMFFNFNLKDFDLVDLPIEADMRIMIYKDDNDFVDALFYILPEGELETSIMFIPMSDDKLKKVKKFMASKYTLITEGVNELEMPYAQYESADGMVGVDLEVGNTDLIQEGVDFSKYIPGFPVDASKDYILLIYYEN